MLTIDFVEIQEEIEIGELFDQLGFDSQVVPDPDGDGDTCRRCEWDIEIASAAGKYRRVEGIRWTKPETVVELRTEMGSLKCSPDHVVMADFDGDLTWVKTRHLVPGRDSVATANTLEPVVSVVGTDDVVRLCDLQVEKTHCYLANGILSHNSHWLVDCGAAAMSIGKNVLYFTLELSEHQVALRHDSNLCDIDYDDLYKRKADVYAHYDANKYGRLKVKYFPTGGASVMTLRSHVELLAVRGFRPDIILIDYADILRSSRQFDSLRHELKLVYEELRGWAGELQIPIWTASQSNKEGANADIIDVTNMSEGYGKAFVADVVLTISRKAAEKSSGYGRMFLAKSRVGKDGMIYPIRIDTARSQITCTGGELTSAQALADGESDIREAVREKWEASKRSGSDGLVVGPSINAPHTTH